jgi:hypothetical protein
MKILGYPIKQRSWYYYFAQSSTPFAKRLSLEKASDTRREALSKHFQRSSRSA